MNHVGNWVMGGVTALLAVGGLFVAATAAEGVPYYGGLLFFVFAVLLVF
ncbi:MAG: hypothetical protein HOK82_22205, partial [Rhodospirillaceae bacterium]|nr:hypothetical protein [Rhodospirillaceae bacterium]